MQAPRIDAWFTWVPWGWPSDPLALTTIPDACTPGAMGPLEGAVVLLPVESSGDCSLGQVAVNVEVWCVCLHGPLMLCVW